jgi:RimJ/RimL family protein N-acetyltransferase
MSLGTGLVATWRRASSELVAFEPTHEEVVRFSPTLADYYNDPHNRSMMANTVEMTANEVVEHFDLLRRSGGRPFLLELDGELLGDADFRHVQVTSAEFAILVGRRSAQGKGIGLCFATLLHALAFREFGLDTVFVSIIPANVASQRVFAKLGYVADHSPAARAFAEEESDLTFSIDRAAFEARHASALPDMKWRSRSPG